MAYYRRRRRSRAASGAGGGALILFALLLILLFGVLLEIAQGIDRLIENIESQPTWSKVLLFLLAAFLLTVYIRRKWILARIRRIKEAEERMQRKKVQAEHEAKRHWERETLEGMKAMHWFDFEHYIAELFTKQGYICEVTKGSGDGGKDIVMHRQVTQALSLAECKRYGSKKVGRPDIQKFHSAMIDMCAENGFFVTTSGFTQDAAEYAKNKNITLIDGDRLLKMKAHLEEK